MSGSKKKKSKGMSVALLDKLTKIAQEASPGPWGHDGNGQVFVGQIARQEPGMTALKRGGVFMLEIESSIYADLPGMDGPEGEAACVRRARADAAFIGMFDPSVALALLKENARLRRLVAEAGA